MGLGDELMAAGRARDLALKTGKKVQITHANGEGRWHELWGGSPYITRHDEDCVKLHDSPDYRPYVDVDSRRNPRRFIWKAGAHTRGDLWLTKSERRRRKPLATTYIAIQPTVKRDNKDWGRGRWQLLSQHLAERGVALAQAVEPDKPSLPGVHRCETRSIREAAGVIYRASGVITAEGVFHHLAAVWHKPAVVLYGAWITPEITGYPEQVSITHGDHGPCGLMAMCKECRAAMRAITLDRVIEEAEKLC